MLVAHQDSNTTSILLLELESLFALKDMTHELTHYLQVVSSSRRGRMSSERLLDPIG